MKITNHLDKYIKISSDTLQSVINDPSLFESITINANKCYCPVETDTILDLDGDIWVIDLTVPINLNNIIHKLKFISLPTGTIYEAQTSTIGISDVAMLELQIDAWYTSIGIASNVSVSLNGNTLTITNIPNQLVVPYSIVYGGIAPETEIFFSYSALDKDIFISESYLYINPSLFGDNTLTDDVYKIELIYKKVNGEGYISETNCAFIDVKTKCKAAVYLATAVDESKTDKAEDVGMTVMLLHYGLVNGSNCGCNCDELCTAFKELNEILAKTDPQLIVDCGC